MVKGDIKRMGKLPHVMEAKMKAKPLKSRTFLWNKELYRQPEEMKFADGGNLKRRSCGRCSWRSELEMVTAGRNWSWDRCTGGGDR